MPPPAGRRIAWAKPRVRLRIVLAAGLTALAGCWFPANSHGASAYQAPSSIAHDCSVDVTQPLLSWIASVPDNSTLSFASAGCYRIEGTLEIRGRDELKTSKATARRSDRSTHRTISARSGGRSTPQGSPSET